MLFLKYIFWSVLNRFILHVFFILLFSVMAFPVPKKSIAHDALCKIFVFGVLNSTAI